ncbi:unnamed protein product [Ceutorhynchus assimilis]|uniref:Uncharacterized protein n=1 Tax=Ceutorhynchus assimilis TaxID=467358 RepID=A0A9N9MN06_9CUCU|nr:unnamed protein product [Ceutorhynchus assimilis]
MVEKAMAMSSDIPGTSGLEKREDTNSELQNSCDKFSDNDHLKHNIEVDDIEESEDSDDSVKDKDYGPTASDESSVDSDFDQQEVPLQEITEAETNNNNITIVEKYKGRPKKGRKIKHEGQDRAKRKKLTNSNKQYYSAKGKLVHPKEFVEYICPCSMECHQKVSIEERRQFFDHYWNLGDYNVQTTYLSTCVREEKKKRAHTAARNPEKRQFSRQYFINKHLVCRNMFVKTLQISTKRINTSLCKIRKLSTLDCRGVAGGHNKISDEQKNSVISHINKFPRYKSHYCRMKKDKQEYLTEGTTLTVMYKLYKDENVNNPSKSLRKIPAISATLYIKIKNLPAGEEKDKISMEHSVHLAEAEKARSKMNSDIEKAINNNEIETLTFDMEKTLPLPRISTNIIFYKRQLWLYNCGIFAGKETKSTFNLWLEGQAGRGAQEVGSCLLLYIANNISKTVKNLILWSDSCGGQNRNIKMVLLLKCALEVSTHLESIELRFLVSGHSFLPNDSDFGDVECVLKRQTKMYSPEDYIQVMKSCRRQHPIEIVSMEKKNFVSTKMLEKEIINRKKSCVEEKINWLKIKEIKILKESPYSIFIKTNYEDSDDYKEINIKKGKGKPQKTPFSRHLTPLWPDGKPIAEAKLKDIKSYLHLIPLADHPFYVNLIGDDTIEEDLEGYNANLDFEIEED